MTDPTPTSLSRDALERSQAFERAITNSRTMLIALLDASETTREEFDHRPVEGSIAMDEASRQHEFAGQWGEAPLDDARMIIAMLMGAAELHIWGFCDLLVAEKTGPNTLDVLARAAIENLARAVWLSEPSIGIVERIKRAETERLFSAAEEGKLGPERMAAANDRKQRIIATANELGWGHRPSKKGTPARLVERPTATMLVGQLLLDTDEGGLGKFLYRLLSASTHGTTYGLARYIHRFDDAPDGRTDLGVLAVGSEEVDVTARALAMAYVSAMRPWLTYLGWESETWSKSVANSFAMLGGNSARGEATSACAPPDEPRGWR